MSYVIQKLYYNASLFVKSLNLQPMKKSNFYKLVFSIVIALGTLACNPNDQTDDIPATDPTTDDPSADVGEDAPDFSLTDLNGSTIKRSDFDGKVLVMFFFGNSCPTCKSAGPNIQSQLADTYSSDNRFAIIGLDQWNGNTSAVNNFKTVTGISFPLLLNASSTASAYKTTYDRLLVVDKVGKIRFRGTRLASNDLDSVITTVQQYIDE